MMMCGHPCGRAFLAWILFLVIPINSSAVINQPFHCWQQCGARAAPVARPVSRSLADRTPRLCHALQLSPYPAYRLSRLFPPRYSGYSCHQGFDQHCLSPNSPPWHPRPPRRAQTMMANAVCAPCAPLPSSVEPKPALLPWAHSRASGYLSNVPNELLSVVLSCLDAKELCVVAGVAQRLRKASASEHLWKPLFEAKFGKSKLLDRAHKLAGSWKALYQAKVETALAAQPWRKPCSFELQAALQDMVSPAPRGNPGATAAVAAAPAAAEAADSGGDALRVVFLVDGSGSVGEEDFSCMMSFLDTAAQAVAAVPHSKLAVVQFSNDTKVEVALGPLDKSAFDSAIAGMVRMNGGTNIAAAVAKAGALLKAEEPAGPPSRRVLALLTDGRIDSFQAREASQMVARLADEQSHVSLWAWGVGRGVDAAELMRIIEGAGEACKGLGPERYVELYVRDDAPW